MELLLIGQGHKYFCSSTFAMKDKGQKNVLPYPVFPRCLLQKRAITDKPTSVGGRGIKNSSQTITRGL